MSQAADGVLLIHAFPLDHHMWDATAEDLRAGGWRMAAPSLPGFGGSEGTGSVMSMGSASDRCMQALDAQGIERAVICGLSMGGYVAFEIWRMARQRVAGFVLANTRSGADTDEAAEGRRSLAAKLRAEGSGFLVDAPPPLLAAPLGEGHWPRVLSSIGEQPAEAIAAAAEGMAERRDSTPDLGTIDVPCLVLTSEKDTLIPPATTLEMAEHIRDAQAVTLAGAGHLSNVEAASAFSEALTDFLGGFRNV
ncbi:MAG: alpha/beta hydrolase [Actinomycetota bacterium]|nr:alpha/beta hydrolase [Actinomycetota bacterium]